MSEQYHKTVLDNGVRIVSEEISAFKSVSFGIWVTSGSKNETKIQRGISHFIEHMFFKGTNKRTAKEISEAIESKGGILNAFTSREYTCFYTKTLDKHLKIAIDILTDMFFNSKFENKEMVKEKNVILEEINMYEDLPQESIIDFFLETLIGKNSLGLSTIGTKETVEKIKRKDILNFLKENYSAEKIIITAVGSVKHKLLIEYVKKAFSQLSAKKKKKLFEKMKMHIPVAIKNKETEQVHLCLGMNGCSIIHPDRYVLALLNTILGGGMSSRLFQEIREKKGLVYAIYSFIEAYKNVGVLGIYAGVKYENIEQVIELILLELKKIRKEGIKKEILDRAKNQIKGHLILSLESTNARMVRLATTETYFNKLLTLNKILKDIDKVTEEDIKRVTQKLIQDSSLVLVLIGKGVDKFKKIKLAL